MYGIIYQALNLVNNKRYIGQTIQSLKKRKREHFSTTSCVYFHRALEKYPEEFQWEWSIIDTADTKEELNEKEKYWIQYYNSNNNKYGYNLTAGGQGSVDVHISEEHKRLTHLSMLKTCVNNYHERQLTNIMIKCVELNKVFFSLNSIYKELNIYASNIKKVLDTDKDIKGYHFVSVSNEERIKYLPNAVYCVELNKIYENYRQARVIDRFHEGHLRIAMEQSGNPYEAKHYAGYTFYWINPDFHIVAQPNNPTTKQIC